MSAVPQHSLQEQRRGLAITAFTFTLWGLVPVYWHLLQAVPSQQIIAHRIIWSTVLVVAWLLLSAGTGWWKQIAAQKRALPTLALSSVAIAFNWGLYIWAINAGHVIETSLGLLLGVFFFRESFDAAKAIGFAAIWIGLLLFIGDSVWRSRRG